MKINVNDEVKNIQSSSASSYTNNAMPVSSVSKQDAFSAVFENGVTDKFIENSTKSGSEALDEAESANAKQMQQQLSSLADTVNKKEISEIEEDVDSVEDEDIRTIVTVQEKIRMQLAAFCDDFDSGMIEDFSEDELAAVGSMKGNAISWAKRLKESDLPVTKDNLEKIQFAFELAGQISGVSDGVKEFFIKNLQKDITIESMYLASYSSSSYSASNQNGSYYSVQAGGYLTQNTLSGDFDSMLPQIRNILAEEDVQIDEQVLSDAKWLYDRQLPVCKETIDRLQEMNELEKTNNNTDQLLSRMIDAMYEGKLAVQANLTGATLEQLAAKATEILDTVKSITDDHIKSALAGGNEDLTISDINTVIDNEESLEMAAQISDTDIRFITAKRQLEEIRLQMTLQSVITMEKQGISVDTLSMSDMVEQLKIIENNYNSNILLSAGAAPTEENIELFAKVNCAVEVIKNSPAQLVGTVAFSEESIILSKLEEEGASLTKEYKAAYDTYESVMTKPRADMGDSIQTAFRNVDDILKEMDLEVNKYNQRAVRILGYNSIEITVENIAKVKEADIQLNQLLSNMTPGAVLKMIRDNYNPMQASLSELEGKLQEIKSEGFEDQNKYSEFLWKLEQKNEITSRERETFIGIYRLLNQIEKSDGALVGTLISQGSEITMNNLLSALRSRRHGSMDYVVNDEFSGVNSNLSNSISEQIEKGFDSGNTEYYAQLAERTIDNMNINAMTEALKDNKLFDMSFEQFAELIEENSEDQEAQIQFKKFQIELVREIKNTDQQILNILDNYNIPVTINNITALKEMLSNETNWSKKLFEKMEQSDELSSGILNKAEKLLDSLLDEVTMKSAYEAFAKESEQELKQSIIEEQETFIDVRTMKLISTQISIASKMSNEEMYQVPVKVGEEITAINLKFRYNTGEKRKVGISMETQEYGCMSGVFTVSGNRLQGYIAVSKAEGLEFMQHIKDSFSAQISSVTSLEIVSVSVVQHENISNADLFSDDSSENESVAGSRDLYQVAKIFIETLKQ